MHKPCERISKTIEHEGDSSTNCSIGTWMVPKGLDKKKQSNWNSKEELRRSRLQNY